LHLHIHISDGPTIYTEKKNHILFVENANVPRGINNTNNTCYINATIQSLFYVPSVRNWLMCHPTCTTNINCTICAMRDTLKESTKTTHKAFEAEKILDKLATINEEYATQLGQQQDAHEFLIYLLSSFKESARTSQIDPPTMFDLYRYNKSIRVQSLPYSRIKN
jgi:uncharacterized UBP type Zn finger protein